MSGVKIETAKTVIPNAFVNLHTDSEKNIKKNGSIMDRGIIKEIESEHTASSASSAEMEALCEVHASIVNVESTLKDMGAPALRGAANTISTKSKAVVNGVANALNGYDKEITGIAKDESLTESEKKSKIELLEAKKSAMIKEGDMKLAILEKLSNALLDMLPMFEMLKLMGADTNSLTNTIKQLVQNIDSSPSSLKSVKNTVELKKTSDSNMKNIFGKNSNEDMKKYINKIDKKIEDKEQRDKDPFENFSDRTRYKEEVKVLKLQKKLLTDILKQLDSFKTDENS